MNDSKNFTEENNISSGESFNDTKLLEKLQSCNHALNETAPKKFSKGLLAAICSAIVLIAVVFGVSFASCYELTSNGAVIGYADSQSALDVAVTDARDIVGARAGVDASVFEAAIDSKKVLKPFATTLKDDALRDLLVAEAQWNINGAILNVNNGAYRFSFLSKEEGQAVLDDLVNEALAKNAEAEIISTSFLEQVVLEETTVDLNNITTTAEALATIRAGKEAVKTHVVAQGESLWTIAAKHDISVSTLQELNPGVSEKRMQIGETLELTKLEPLVNVVVNKVVTVEESIPFGEIVQESSTLLKGERAVLKPGIEGSKTVTYQISEASGETLEKVSLREVINKEPIDQIIEKGTATVATAARGGDGALNWPTTGKITSPYGYRSSGFHNGIDLGAKHGTAVTAAAGGKVVLASYSGGYGYCVLIDHGNGMRTRYAHLSKINCSVGQTLLRGERLGSVGSTGNSTGPHLHFEVIVNGSTKNPINYLK